MGPSGSGKSTLLHCLAGLDTLTAGRAFVGDVELGDLSDRQLTLLRRDRIGFVFQAFNLVPTLSARDNITLPMTLAGTAPDPDWLATVIERTGLTDRLGHRPAELSGGQQQRVAVARALASRPQIVFADEPTGNLDSRSGHEVLELLRAARDEFGQTIVMVTHDPVAAGFADASVVMADGRVGEMIAITARNLWARKRRLVATLLAVGLGVAFLAGTLLLSDTLRANFDRLFTQADGGTDVVLRGATQIGSGNSARTGVDASLLPAGAGRARGGRRPALPGGLRPAAGSRRQADRRQRPADRGGELGRRPGAEPVPARGGARPAGRRRGGHQPGRGQDRPSGARHDDHAADPAAAAGARRRHHHLRHGRRLRAGHVHRDDAARRAAAPGPA